MPDPTPERIRRAIGELDRRIARVELQAGTATGAVAELQRAGLCGPDETEQLVAGLWQLVERLKDLRDGWAELHASLAGEGGRRVPPRDLPAVH